MNFPAIKVDPDNVEKTDPGLVNDADPPMIFRDNGPSCAKVKARDIIDGWPKGRSTVPEYSGPADQYMACVVLRLMLRTNRTYPHYINQTMSEALQTRDYHQAQADMVESWMHKRRKAYK